MANKDETFDPFGLQLEQSDDIATASKTRPVLIAVSEGPAEPEPNGQGPIHPSSTEETFDPFHIGASTPKTTTQQKPQQPMPVASPLPPPPVSRITHSQRGITLPPKLTVKLTVHEEVSSVAKVGKELEGTSQVTVDGTIYAQVQCSDARKNAPFCLQATPQPNLQVRANSQYAQEDPLWVEIPKQEIGHVPVAYYSLQDEIEHMPILLERKVTVLEKSCRIAVQVRSKLTNMADLEDFTIAVAVPDLVDSIEIVRGEGQWDDLRRIITWKLASLNKGESFMVSAKANFWKEPDHGEPLEFPVLLRCSSTADQISSVDFQVGEAHGHPSSTSYQKTHSFRLLHRLR